MIQIEITIIYKHTTTHIIVRTLYSKTKHCQIDYMCILLFKLITQLNCYNKSQEQNGQFVIYRKIIGNNACACFPFYELKDGLF